MYTQTSTEKLTEYSAPAPIRLVDASQTNNTICETVTSRSQTLLTPPSPPESTLSIQLPKVECMVRARLPTSIGTCHVYLYQNEKDQKEHLAIVFGDRHTAWSRSLERPKRGETTMDRIIRGASTEPEFMPTQSVNSPLVRIHSECFTGETLCSVRCDCGEQLLEAMRMMHRQGQGIINLRQEGRGIGLLEKLK
jgi:GTP cyclohydrolase II